MRTEDGQGWAETEVSSWVSISGRNPVAWAAALLPRPGAWLNPGALVWDPDLVTALNLFLTWHLEGWFKVPFLFHNVLRSPFPSPWPLSAVRMGTCSVLFTTVSTASVCYQTESKLVSGVYTSLSRKVEKWSVGSLWENWNGDPTSMVNGSLTQNQMFWNWVNKESGCLVGAQGLLARKMRNQGRKKNSLGQKVLSHLSK